MYVGFRIFILFLRFFSAWGFGFLSVTIISCASLLGTFVVPFMNQSLYEILLLFMVSLAVGVLSGSGFFHLIPHVSVSWTSREWSFYRLKKDPIQPPPFSMPSILLIFQLEAKLYCFDVSYVPESMFNP